MTNYEDQPQEERRHAELLRLFLEATQDGLLDWNPTTGQVRYNARWFHLFGFDGDELRDSATPDLWLSLVHPEDLPAVRSQLQDHLGSGWPLVMTIRLAHRAGGYRYTLCRGTSQRHENDQPVRTVIVFSSVDEQVRGEERQRALLAAVPDTVLRFNELGTITALKQGQERENSPLLELREGKSLRDLGLIPPELLDRFFSDPKSRRDPANPSLSPSPSQRISRNGFHYDIRAIRCSGDEVICIVRDITSEMELETHLLETQKLGAIGQLSAGVAHEINTPMQFIGDNLYYSRDAISDLLKLVGRLKTLALSRDNSNDVDASIEEIETEADFEYVSEALPRGIERSLMGVERVTKIVRALKSFAHPDVAGFVSTNVRDLVESTVTVATNEWKYLAEVELELPENLPELQCIPGELSQVILNLIVNASHAIQDVVGTSGEKGTIAISAHEDEDHIELRVRDTGTGIPVNVRPRIFEQFFTTKEVGKGTGMGLSFVYSSITIRHGGYVSFETAEGKGTTFILRLPKHQAADRIAQSA